MTETSSRVVDNVFSIEIIFSHSLDNMTLETVFPPVTCPCLLCTTESVIVSFDLKKCFDEDSLMNMDHNICAYILHKCHQS